MLILMEGIYLHNLLFLSMYSEKNDIKYYVLFGWCKYIDSIRPIKQSQVYFFRRSDLFRSPDDCLKDLIRRRILLDSA